MDSQTQFQLARMLGMLGSDHEGEVLAAARAIKKLLERNGLTFADLVMTVANPTLPAVHDEGRSIAGMARAMLINEAMMHPHERVFVKDMLVRAMTGFNCKMSEKQSSWFTYLFTKYGA